MHSGGPAPVRRYSARPDPGIRAIVVLGWGYWTGENDLGYVRYALLDPSVDASCTVSVDRSIDGTTM
jgi:hypothetical protein